MILGTGELQRLLSLSGSADAAARAASWIVELLLARPEWFEVLTVAFRPTVDPRLVVVTARAAGGRLIEIEADFDGVKSIRDPHAPAKYANPDGSITFAAAHDALVTAKALAQQSHYLDALTYAAYSQHVHDSIVQGLGVPSSIFGNPTPASTWQANSASSFQFPKTAEEAINAFLEAEHELRRIVPRLSALSDFYFLCLCWGCLRCRTTAYFDEAKGGALCICRRRAAGLARILKAEKPGDFRAFERVVIVDCVPCSSASAASAPRAGAKAMRPWHTRPEHATMFGREPTFEPVSRLVPAAAEKSA